MTDILTDLSPPSLALAIKANLYAFFQSMRGSSKATIHESSYGFRWHTSIPHPWFNGMLCSRPPAEDVVQVIRDTVVYFQSRGVASFTWWLAPSLEPAIWSQHLLAHGFQYANSTPGMGMDLADLPPLLQHSLTIRTVKDRHTLAEWAHTFVRGYGLPDSMRSSFQDLIESLGIDLPLRHYIGYINDKPLAVSTLFIGAGVAGIYNVATISEARGQGFGSAMTLVPLYEAREMGYNAGVLQSSEMGHPVYQRLGFQKLCQIDHFYWQV